MGDTCAGNQCVLYANEQSLAAQFVVNLCCGMGGFVIQWQHCDNAQQIGKQGALPRGAK